MKTSDLTGSMLDYWVAKAEGHEPTVDSQMKFTPSTSWAQGGPIIERERIAVMGDDETGWAAAWQTSSDEVEGLPEFRRVAGECWQFGPAALIAAMRAFVAQKFGEDVPSVVDKPDGKT